MLTFLDVPFEITSDKDKILNAEKIIFPGQGHFAQAMSNLEKKGLVPVIKECCSKGTPFLGICIGLQILFEKSEEAPNVQGLGIFKGEVKKFTQGKIPQIGWNDRRIFQQYRSQCRGLSRGRCANSRSAPAENAFARFCRSNDRLRSIPRR